MSIVVNKSEIPETVIEAKRWWRKEIRRILGETTEEYRSSASAAIAVNVLTLPEVARAKTVLAYFSVGTERGTLAIISKLMDMGKRVCLPLCIDLDENGKRIEAHKAAGPEKEGAEADKADPAEAETAGALNVQCVPDAMEAREIRSFDDLVPGAYGIPEPAPHTAVVTPEEIDVIILPCLACDKSCRRLGHGGGYYDRYLSQISEKCMTAALCYEAVLADELPVQKHDIPADAVITEKAIYRWRDNVDYSLNI